jgi:triosephosphate isomerase (TIM)
MRRPLIAGNWKMHKTIGEAVALVTELRKQLSDVRDCDMSVAPPFTAVHAVAEKLAGSNIAVAGQDLFWEEKGAFTGQVCASMLKEAGATQVLIAHSERRQFFGETNETSNKRLKAALKAGLVPILCVGETLAEREGGRTGDVVKGQLEGALAGLSPKELTTLVVAYEPVWAIGTGKVATPAQAQEVHALIRAQLRAKDANWADTVRILYGGSVKPDNARELLSQADIDGALVGGASLDAANFAGIVKARAAH